MLMNTSEFSREIDPRTDPEGLSTGLEALKEGRSAAGASYTDSHIKADRIDTNGGPFPSVHVYQLIIPFTLGMHQEVGFVVHLHTDTCPVGIVAYVS
jgi:hypothetical protein